MCKTKIGTLLAATNQTNNITFRKNLNYKAKHFAEFNTLWVSYMFKRFKDIFFSYSSAVATSVLAYKGVG